MKYRKKPVVVEAFQLTEENAKSMEGWPGWLAQAYKLPREAWGSFCWRTHAEPEALMRIGTLEGEMLVTWGDFIIQGVRGEIYPCKPDIFEATYEPVEETLLKTLHSSDISGTKVNVPDVVVFGDGDAWQLICKASSKTEGWMKSTKAMELPNGGCLIQVTTQQCDNVSEALTFVPGVGLVVLDDGSRGFTSIHPTPPPPPTLNTFKLRALSK